MAGHDYSSRGGRSYTVTYNSKSQWSVLTQRWGSLWPLVLPYCLVNTALMAALQILLVNGIDLNIQEAGHSFLSLVMAFLLVSRVSTSLARYDAARDALENMNKSCRQLVHTVCVYSNTDSSVSAKEWRSQVTYRALLLLRTSMAVIDYNDSRVKVSEIPELSGPERLDLQQHLPLSNHWLHESRTDYEENLRIPIRLSYLLRKSIRSQEVRIKPPLHVIAEGDLYAFVNGFMDGYHAICKLLTTPVPFPLIQMTSTFLWFYIFTVPFALLSADDTGVFAAVAHCLVVFALTFGFVGMDLISIQLDDPFGEDENDFKYVLQVMFLLLIGMACKCLTCFRCLLLLCSNLALAQMAFEDAYLTIQDVDGAEWANILRKKMNSSVEQEKVAKANESTWLKRSSA